jgi:hypothetical protein
VPVPAILRLYVGDVVELKKPHPCGANAWEILRLGVDVKLRCGGCGHIVRIPRVRLERRVRAFLHRGEARAPSDAPPHSEASLPSATEAAHDERD